MACSRVSVRTKALFGMDMWTTSARQSFSVLNDLIPEPKVQELFAIICHTALLASQCQDAAPYNKRILIIPINAIKNWGVTR
jgi:hypothetical protein